MQIQIHDSLVLLCGKIILALIIFATGVFCLIVFSRARQWQEKLLALEAECDSARDSVIMCSTIVRNQLAGVHDRLTTKHEKSDFEAIGNLINQAMPIVNLFVHKETSLFRWGFVGVKLVRSIFKYFSCLEKN